MYCEFYSFSEKPFDVTPDPKFLYLSPSHQEMLASLLYGIKERRGFISIIGEVGTGKTTLLNALLDRLDEKTKVAYMFNTAVSYDEMLNMALVDLGLISREQTLSKVEAIHRLNDFAIEQLAKGCNVVVIVDEAHNLDDSSMENLRLLSNLETRKHKLLQIVLSGQPELDTKLRKPELRQLAQRISLKRYIIPLNEKETYEYIQHRLRIVSQNSKSVFSGKAKQLIWEHSEGIPRKINIVCDNAFLIGYGLGKKRINEEILGEAIRDISWSPFAKIDESPSEQTFHKEEGDLSESVVSSRSAEVSTVNRRSYWLTLSACLIIVILLLIGAGFLSENLLPKERWVNRIRSFNPLLSVNEKQQDNTSRFVSSRPSKDHDEIVSSKEDAVANMTKELARLKELKDEKVRKEPRLNSDAGAEEEYIFLKEKPSKVDQSNDTPLAQANNQMGLLEENVKSELTEDLVGFSNLKSGKEHEEPGLARERVTQVRSDLLRLNLDNADRSVGEVIRSARYNEAVTAKENALSDLIEVQVKSEGLKENTNRNKPSVNPRTIPEERLEVSTREIPFVVVKRNDFLCNIIARNYGHYRDRLLDALLEENPEIENPDLIFPGQIIKLPLEDDRK